MVKVNGVDQMVAVVVLEAAMEAMVTIMEELVVMVVCIATVLNSL